ncbi:MAG: 4-alpha-glucanotransferase, partial [Candidatus Omnitrophota bacterium]|nr:4-alpha-glucanotransferase [Candidatus Omnitrophota bacterium]
KVYRKLSVAMLSTHDTTNWAAWWENEAGTADEALFMRKTVDRKIDYRAVLGRLFDPALSRHGRLRWLKSVDSVDKFVEILGKPREHLRDFIELYENTYLEKEKLWKQLNLKGAMREKSDALIVKAALGITLNSSSVFCIELLNDYLYLADMFKGDPYDYRINRPGTVNKNNWSTIIPISLEGLLKHKQVCRDIKRMIRSSGRI